MEENTVTPAGMIIILHTNNTVCTQGAEFLVNKPFKYNVVKANIYDDMVRATGEPVGGFTHMHALIDLLLIEGYITPMLIH